MKERTPVVSSTEIRFGLNLIWAVSAKGEIRFMTDRGRFAASQFFKYIKRLLHGVRRMVFLIVDDHPTQEARNVIHFIRSIKDPFAYSTSLPQI